MFVETELVDLAKKGHDRAFEELIRPHQDLAFRLAVVLVGDPDVAADVTQEAIIKAHGALPRFDTTRPFRPWLIRIVANQARDTLKTRKRREFYTIRLAQQQATGKSSSPEDLVLADDDHRQLAAALDELNPVERNVIAMRYFLELSESEMAEALKCRRGTVKSRLSRALAHLRVVLEPEETVVQEVRVNA